MKKTLILTGVLFLGIIAQAQPEKVTAEEKQVPAVVAQASGPLLTQKEQYKRFKARTKQIRKLKKAYHKASSQEKPVIKQQLFTLVSQATDESRAWACARIAAERAHLDRWEQHIRQEGTDLAQTKARRVDDILSGEAEMRHKLAQKRWKKEMKEYRKRIK